MPKASYLYLAVISEYYSAFDWQQWADEEIVINDDVEEWIYEISICSDRRKVCEILYNTSLDECYYEHDEVSKEDIIVGYYYMMFIEKRISLYEIISKLADEDDISVDSSIHNVMNFYEFFLKVKETPQLLEDKELKKYFDSVFLPYVKSSEQQNHILKHHNI